MHEESPQDKVKEKKKKFSLFGVFGLRVKKDKSRRGSTITSMSGDDP
jgi:hypothetical protein